MIGLEIIAAWLFADFVSGVVHWIEDRYMDGMHSLEFARGVATDNILHHDDPSAMTRSTPWENMRSSAYFAFPVAAIAWFFDAPLWLWLGLGFSAFGNLIHRFSHMPKRDVPRVIRAMQELGIFISPKHHATHHFAMGRKTDKAESNRAYCPMTDWLNPVLDYFHFWLWCERGLSLIGVNPIAPKVQS